MNKATTVRLERHATVNGMEVRYVVEVSSDSLVTTAQSAAQAAMRAMMEHDAVTATEAA